MYNNIGEKMFDLLSKKLTKSLGKVKKGQILTEENMSDALREIRMSLLEADVNFKVVKHFVSEIKAKTIGTNLIGSLNAYETVVKIVHEQLVNILGSETKHLDITKRPTVIMMVGLQGSGKTTTTGKIALMLKKKKAKNPLLVAADIYRPAAIKQLKQLAGSIQVDFFEKGQIDPREITKAALAHAKENNNDVVIIDTAGRLHINEELMTELKDVKEICKPQEILMVVDSMSGQDIINVADSFNKDLDITGTVITKLDGDARGGAALSISYLLGLPIKFIGTGEKISQIDIFHPDRMADRILGMGDVLSLIEKANDVIDQDSMKKSFNRMMAGSFGFDDLVEQMKQIRKIGKLGGILRMIPGMPKMSKEQKDVAEKKIFIAETLINSMTKRERRHPKIIQKSNSRKQRVLKGSGRTAQEFNSLFKQWEQMEQMLANIQKGKMPNIPGMGGMGFPGM